MKKLLFILLGFFSLNAFAVDPTQGPLQQHPALCQYGYNPNCGQNPSPPQKIIQHIIVDVPSKYGALAMDKKTGTIGDSVNENSLSEAKKAAIRQCGKAGCKVITWVRNGCIAAAGGKLNGKLALYKAAEIPGEAESVAMGRCKKASASNCQIVVPEVCSVPEGMYD